MPRGRSALAWSRAVRLAAAGLLFASGSAPAGVSVTESFQNSTAPGWTFIGSAVLTGNGVIDSAGAGWLRLTSAAGTQAGSAIYDTAFSSDDGVTVNFTYATYGGSGADGFTFYLIDGSTASPTVGTTGGALGYASADGTKPGVTNGYVGIGFDEYGNFSAAPVGTCNPSCPLKSPNSVAIRGSGSLLTGFNYLTKASATIGTASRLLAKAVTVTVVNNKITVVHAGTTVIDQYDLSTAVGQSTTPRTFKMGFSASTGGSTNVHEIRGLSVAGVKTSTSVGLVSSVNPSVLLQSVTFTATVSPSAATGTVTFLDGATSLGTANVAAGVATFTTSALGLGTHPITAVYSGDTTYGISSAGLDQVVSAGAAGQLAFTTNPSGTGTAGTAWAQQPVVTVQDASGNTVPSYTTAVTLALASGSGTLTCTTNPVTPVNGVATFAGCSVTGLGSFTLKATSGSFTNTTTNPPVVITAPTGEAIPTLGTMGLAGLGLLLGLAGILAMRRIG